MFCPRCGAESEDGSRYCASCGAELPKPAQAEAEDAGQATTFGERVAGLIGRDRRTRIVTLGTAAAILIALAAFIALDASEDEGSDVPQDSYTRLVDASCVQRKGQIAKAQRLALSGAPDALVRYADTIVPIAGEWRLALGRGPVPADRADLVQALRAALLEVQIEAGTLARVARESNPREVAEVAARVDAATTNVEVAIDGLGLERCGQLTISQGQLVRQ